MNWAVVAGNGPSLAEIGPGRVLATDFIVRTNSFFLEKGYHLGSRVDLAFVAGDPRVAPFLFATLDKCQGIYDIRAWTAAKPKVIVAGRKFLNRPYEPLRLRDGDCERQMAALCARYQAEPTSGVLALFMAHALGARNIVTAGIDLYSGPNRYAFPPGRHMRDLLGQDIPTRSYDTRLHSNDLDRALIDWLAGRDDVTLYRSTAASTVLDLDLAPIRDGPLPDAGYKRPVTDWVSWAGWYPIGLLKAGRAVKKFQRTYLK